MAEIWSPLSLTLTASCSNLLSAVANIDTTLEAMFEFKMSFKVTCKKCDKPLQRGMEIL